MYATVSASSFMCALYMKDCYFMHSVLCTFEMGNIATILSLYDKSKHNYSIPIPLQLS